jgi:hypothetical protein
MSLSEVQWDKFHFRNVLTSTDPREELIQEQKLRKLLEEGKGQRLQNGKGSLH